MRVYNITLANDFSSDQLVQISQQAGNFYSDIELLNGDAIIDVKSLLGMMLFPLKKGSVVTIRTNGKDEEAALEFIRNSVENIAR